MDANEARVREVWVDVTLQWGKVEGKRYVMVSASGRALPLHGYETESEAWSAAAAYTETVLEEKRQLREAIDELGKFPKRAWVQYTLGRLEAAYASHVRGLKPEALEEKP